MDLAAIVRSSLAELRTQGYSKLRDQAPCMDDEVTVSTSRVERKVTRVTFIELQPNGDLVVVVKIFKRSWIPFMSYANADGFRITPDNQIRELHESDKVTLY